MVNPRGRNLCIHLVYVKAQDGAHALCRAFSEGTLTTPLLAPPD